MLLGVSRTSVREAIIALEIAGRVEVRVGTGIFVLGPAARTKPERQRRQTETTRLAPSTCSPPARSSKARSPRSPRATRARSTSWRSARQIARMRKHEQDAVERDAADRRFHILIAEMTGNSALPLAVANLWDLRGGEIWTRIEVHFHTPALRAKTLTDHEAIVAALEAHDADGAREAMHRHLRRVAREFQRRWDGRSLGGRDGP